MADYKKKGGVGGQASNFRGFDLPTTTPIPDQIFDELMTDLTGAELKVLLYICRRTLGFKKESDNISISQLVNGITSRDGRVIDQGTGLSKDTVTNALKGLEQKNIIIRERRQSSERGYEPTTYSLNFMSPCKEGPDIEDNHASTANSNRQPLSENLTRDGGKTGQGLPRFSDQAHVQKSDIQQTVLQETEEQETVEQHDDVVKQTLLNFGVSKPAADQLVKNFSEELILEKLDLAQWLVSTGSSKVARNPAGWLRKAIEDDYPPPRNYIEARKHKDRSGITTQVEEYEDKERSVSEAESQPVKVLTQDQLLQEFPPQPIGEGLTTHTAWDQALKKLKDLVAETTYEFWMKDTLLLEVTDQAARIAVGTPYQVAWIERRLYQPIASVLKEILNKELDLQFVASCTIQNDD